MGRSITGRMDLRFSDHSNTKWSSIQKPDKFVWFEKSGHLTLGHILVI